MSSPLSVSQLTLAIKNQLEQGFRSLSVQGEISNLKPHSAGHLYFDLKDNQAKIAAVMFRNDRASLIQIPKEGDQVIVVGSIGLYPPQGKYQLIVRSLQFKGEGELLLKFHELKKKLENLGFFARERKKSLPKFPKRIGVVTSPTGAVIRDIIHVLSKKFPNFSLILNPVRVQGEGAAQEIAQAIYQFNELKLADILIVGRGGGSLEDLWSFNEEIVAKAIFESQIPIVSAVGHETDVTLSDFVADVRAPTPSVAAEIVICEKAQSLKTLKDFQTQLIKTLSHLIRHHKETLKRFMLHPLLASPYALLGEKLQRLDDIKIMLDERIKQMLTTKKYYLQSSQQRALALRPTMKLHTLRYQLTTFQKNIDNAFLNFCKLRQQKLETHAHRLHALNPKKVLERGYSILFHQKDDSVIVSSRQLIEGSLIKALFAEGEAILTVKETRCE